MLVELTAIVMAVIIAILLFTKHALFVFLVAFVMFVMLDQTIFAAAMMVAFVWMLVPLINLLWVILVFFVMLLIMKQFTVALIIFIALVILVVIIFIVALVQAHRNNDKTPFWDFRTNWEKVWNFVITKIRQVIHTRPQNPLHALDPNAPIHSLSLVSVCVGYVVGKIFLTVMLTNSEYVKALVNNAYEDFTTVLNNTEKPMMKMILYYVIERGPSIANCIACGMFFGIMLTCINTGLRWVYFTFAKKFPKHTEAVLGCCEAASIFIFMIAAAVVWFFYKKIHTTLDTWMPVLTWHQFIDIFIPNLNWVDKSRLHLFFLIASAMFATIFVTLSYVVICDVTDTSGAPNQRGASPSGINRCFKYEAFLMAAYFSAMFIFWNYK